MIIIICPDIVTGGPESLHFLCKKLNDLGLDSRINYLNKTGACLNSFKKYNCPTIEFIEDTCSNIIVIPETFIELSYNFLNTKIIIFWLSLEYFIHSRPYKYSLFRYLDYFIKPKNYFKDSKLKFNLSIYFKNISILDTIKNHTHICNSYYAYNFCKSLFSNVELLRIPIFLTNNIPEKINKKDIVLYNPNKKPFFTFLIILFSRNIKFVPIANLNQEKVYDLMTIAKIYIDFGNHPGRERMPRESALFNCIIITNMSGSAYGIDLPIPNKYKFNESIFNIISIIKFIKLCLKNYDQEIINFNKYKMSIISENLNFDDYITSKLHIFR